MEDIFEDSDAVYEFIRRFSQHGCSAAYANLHIRQNRLTKPITSEFRSHDFHSLGKLGRKLQSDAATPMISSVRKAFS